MECVYYSVPYPETVYPILQPSILQPCTLPCNRVLYLETVHRYTQNAELTMSAISAFEKANDAGAYGIGVASPFLLCMHLCNPHEDLWYQTTARKQVYPMLTLCRPYAEPMLTLC